MTKTENSKNSLYASYLSEIEIDNGLKNGFIKGSLRINPRNYKEAYVTHHKLDSDVFIYDRDINRALFDDIVAIKINSKYDWKVLNDVSVLLTKINDNNNNNNNNSVMTIKTLLKESPDVFKKLQWNVTANDLSNALDFNSECQDWWKYFQRTGKVVGILTKMNSRHCVGSLSLPDSGDKLKSLKFAKFSPTDSRYPRLMIPLDTCPTDFLKRPFDYKDVKFIAKIGHWSETDMHPIGDINQCLKDLPVIEQETIKILVESGFEAGEFNENVLNSIPKDVMTDLDLKYRRDLRQECVISIDPKTARDLDDALHIKRLPGTSSDGKALWEVGVHIADVTYYITPDSEIDIEAANRTTTVYMVHKAVPMLPRELCENVCSLHPGTDKLAYSVIYKITDDCQIVDTWIGRTIISTACKLSYEEAQTVLDNPTKCDWESGNFTEVFPPFTAVQVASSILDLNHLAVQMRRNRFEAGSLWINQPKLGFVLNNDRNCPLGYNIYKLGGSNHLIEEWMLRANMTVAEFLHKHLPQTAFLRSHPPPTVQAIASLNKQFTQIGWEHMCIESGTTEEFQELLKDVSLMDSNNAIMMNICSKIMQLAIYFCNNEDVGTLIGCHHFALNVPLYTHFTSPIRRYADMIVHRQLTTVLMQMESENNKGDESREKIEWLKRTAQADNCSPAKLNGVAEWCNKRRKDAKSADDNSITLFYSLFVEKCGPFNENAVVVGTLDKAFEVLLTHCGFIRRVYLNQLDVRDSKYMKSKGKLTIFWNRDKACTNQFHKEAITILTMLSCIDVTVSATSESNNSAPKIKLVLRNPGCALCQRNASGDENQLKDISSLQIDMNVVDEDRLYNILDDI